MPLWVSFALLGAGILAIYVEIFVPAAGLIGLAGGGMVVAGVVLGYVYHDPMTGSIVLITSLVVTPTAIVIGLRAFPKTPMGRRLILGGGADEASLGEPRTDATDPPSEADDIGPGSEGEALTVLRPSGTGRFGRRRVSVVTGGEFIDRGSPIRVVRVEGNRVVVRASSARAAHASGEDTVGKE